MANSPRYIIVHHSLTEDSETLSWPAIRKYHKNKGWRDVGYHFGIELVGDRHEIIVGRSMLDSGAHCLEEGMNYKSIGICVVGNYDDDAPPLEAWKLLIKLIKDLMVIFTIPVENVRGHREFARYKSCPGKKFNMNLVREALK